MLARKKNPCFIVFLSSISWVVYAVTMWLGHSPDRMLLRARGIEQVNPGALASYSREELNAAFRKARRLPKNDRALIRAAVLYDLDPAVLVAVGTRESRMNPNARGAAGEIGMFQIMPQTARHWAQSTGNPEPSEGELFDVFLNAEISAWYLRLGLDAFSHRSDPLPFALAWYNAGPTNARAWERNTPENADFIPQITFASTRAYVRAILEMLAE